MRHWLEITPDIVSVVVRDNTHKGVTLKTPEAWEGCNSLNTYLNGTYEESIGIYAKCRYQ